MSVNGFFVFIFFSIFHQVAVHKNFSYTPHYSTRHNNTNVLPRECWSVRCLSNIQRATCERHSSSIAVDVACICRTSTKASVMRVLRSALSLSSFHAGRARKPQLAAFQRHLATSTSVDAVLKSMQGGNFLSTAQLSGEQFEALVSKAQEYKRVYSDPATKATAPKPLTGEICSMIFQKRSTRTRISSEVGMHLLGGKALFLSSDDIQLGVNESLKDTALVLSRFNSVILARVFGHQDVLELAELSSVPVINALSDKYHPLQALADYMTIKEHFGKLDGLTFTWVGDGNNVLHDYMLAAPKVGANIRIATPAGYEPDADVVEETQRLAKAAGTSVLMTTDPVEAVKGANVVATDTWISMGQENEKKERLKTFAGYQVSKDMLKYAANDHIFLHCLPRKPEEVTDEVFYSDKSLVFDEAENRLWTVMAVYAALLGKF